MVGMFGIGFNLPELIIHITVLQMRGNTSEWGLIRVHIQTYIPIALRQEQKEPILRASITSLVNDMF